MSEKFQCGDNTALVGYLYDECQADERVAIAQHVTICAACAAELAALESTRSHLASWAPPEADLGFQVIQPQAARILKPDTFVAKPWWRQPIPGWAQAAAAVLIFAAGISLGFARSASLNGSAQIAATAPPTAPLVPSGVEGQQAVQATPVSAQDLAALEQRLRAELSQGQTRATTPANTAPVSMAALPADSEARVLAQMRSMLDDLEQRQTLRLTQLAGDLSFQRRADMATIEAMVGRVDQTFGSELVKQRQQIDNLVRPTLVSQPGR